MIAVAFVLLALYLVFWPNDLTFGYGEHVVKVWKGRPDGVESPANTVSPDVAPSKIEEEALPLPTPTTTKEGHESIIPSTITTSSAAIETATAEEETEADEGWDNSALDLQEQFEKEYNTLGL